MANREQVRRGEVPGYADLSAKVLPPIRLREMLKCAEREFAMRRAVYPKRVADKKLDPMVANREIALMRDIADYLRRDLGES